MCTLWLTVCDYTCVCQALGALDRALQQNLTDLTVRAELYFSKGNQLREMNLLDQAFKVLVSSCLRILSSLYFKIWWKKIYIYFLICIFGGWKLLQVEPLLQIERSQMRWLTPHLFCFLMLELQASSGAQAGPVSGLDEHGRDSAHEGNNSQTCQTST